MSKLEDTSMTDKSTSYSDVSDISYPYDGDNNPFTYVGESEKSGENRFISFPDELVLGESLVGLVERISCMSSSDELDIYISSSGGSVTAAFELAEVINKKNFKRVSVHIVGYANSSAWFFILLLNATDYYVQLGSYVLDHEIRLNFNDFELSGSRVRGNMDMAEAHYVVMHSLSDVINNLRRDVLKYNKKMLKCIKSGGDVIIGGDELVDMLSRLKEYRLEHGNYVYSAYI